MRVILIGLMWCAVALAAPTDTLKSFSINNNQFTADIYKQYHESADSNFVTSPLSVEVLFALIHAGAGGKTADEISKALRLPQKRTEIDQIFRQLHPKLKVEDKYTLQSANKIYVQDGFSVKPDFKTVVAEVYGAAIENINFAQNEAAVTEINSWVATNTRDKITQLVTKDDINSDTRAVLLNAIYFKGKWVNAFQKTDTKQQPFYLTKTSHVDVDMMEQTEYYAYHHSDKLKASFLEMPYEGDDISMTVVLPDEKDGLPHLEKHIQQVVIEPKYNTQRVNLRLPKNKIETFIELTDILQKLHIKEAFTPKANFQGMLDGNVAISRVIQKAFIETDEEGTVAAAVTGTLIVAISAQLPPPIPIDFHADHPFIFFLKHRTAGIMFIGRYSKPE